MTRNISNTKSSIRGFVWLFFGNTFNNLAQVVIIGVLARLLTPEDFGIIGIILLMVNFSNIFTQMGVGTALVQRKHIERDHISLGYTLSVIIGLCIGALFFFIAPYIGEFFNLEGLKEPIQFFSFFFPLKSLNSISESLLQRNLNFPAIVKSKAFSYLFGYGLTAITLALLGYGLWSLIYGQLAILLVHTAILIYYIKPKFSIFNKRKYYKDLLFFGSGHTLDLNFNFFAENADNIVVGKMLDAASLGIYSRAFQLYSIPAGFLGGIYNKVLLPILSAKQDNKKTLTSFYIFSISFCLLVLFPISLVMIYNAELIVMVVLGDQWYEVIQPFQILVIGAFIRFGTMINKSFLTSLGLVYHGALYQFIYASLAVISCIVGAYLYELNGVALGVLFAGIVNYLQVAYRIVKHLKSSFNYFLRLHLRALLSYLPMGIIILISFYFWPNAIWVFIILSIILFIPLGMLPLYLKSSIFHDENNSVMFNQLIDNSPGFVRSLIKKLRIPA